MQVQCYPKGCRMAVILFPHLNVTLCRDHNLMTMELRYSLGKGAATIFDAKGN